MRNTLPSTNLLDEMFRELNRVAIGFEPTLRRLHDVQNTFTTSSNGYPPYDLEEISENHYRITLAVAGFVETDLDIEVKDNQLTITGEKKTDEVRNYLHRGIAQRAFSRVFHLADHVKIQDANLQNGLLTVDLIREVPEALRPRKIAINGTKTIEGDI